MKPGDCVIVHSLQNATQHNEKTGRLLEYSKGAGRWTVELDSQRIIVKPANLRLLSEFMPADGFSFAEFELLTNELLKGLPRARHKLVADGQDEGGFDWRALADLPPCREGGDISWTQTLDVDEATGMPLFLCVVMLHYDGPPKAPGECVVVGARTFRGEPDGMDAMLVLDNAMWKPDNGRPRRPEWILVANRFGKKHYTTIQKQLWLRCVEECVFQDRLAAEESCRHVRPCTLSLCF